ncbi:MAG: hypothetical protein EBR67_08720 [Proteobacteria bacterium]|nr:hypothetical protein [Pseudomonadota bacterium]
MAKINKASRENIWQVRIDVDDPDCNWNINPTSTFYKIIKANNENSAVRGAANYCNRQMRAFPGTFFKYSTKDVRPYYCSVYVPIINDE